MSEDPEDVDAENLALGTPEANAYESSSSGILDLFKKMNGKFDEQLMETQKKEMKDKHAFEMLMTDLTNSKTVATNSRQEKSEAKAKDFESRQTLRAEEIVALEQATEILAGGAVSGAAATHLPALIQNKASSFAQLRA